MTELRVPREEESAAIASLMSRYSPERIAEERVRRAWSAPGVDIEHDSRVVVRDGEVVGFAAVEVEDAYSWLELHGEGAPELIDWAAGIAPGRIYSGGWEQNEAVREALLAVGFSLVRHSYRMGIDLDGTEQEPQWPDGIRVRAFADGDARAVHETHMETFEDTWEHTRQPYEEWEHWMRPGNDPERWRLAVAGDELAGMTLCRILSEQQDVGMVSILGVRRPWRRLGLGKALLHEAFRVLGDAGCTRVVLGVDASSLTGAHRLYESAGMRVLSTFDVYERAA
jgi:mycothiol synthase